MKFPSPTPPTVSVGPQIALDAILALVDNRGAGTMADEDASLIALVDGRRTVAEILRVSRLSGSVALRRLRSLSDRRVLRTVATRFPGNPSPRIANPRMGVTQGFGAVPTAVDATHDPTAKMHVAVHAPKPSAPRPARPPGMPPRPTPARAPSSPPASVIVVGAQADGFHDMPATPPPQPVRNPPAKAPSTSSTGGALVPVAAKPPAALIERTTAPRSGAHPSINAFPSQVHDLWFRVSRRPWSTLVLIPAHGSGSALSVGAALSEIGAAYTGKAIALLSAEGRELEPPEHWIFPRHTGSTEGFARVLVLEPLSCNPRGIAVAQAADAVVLVAEAGAADLAAARGVVDKIGRQRFLGSVMLTAR